jgi:shikimate dehydrogenase
MHNREVPLRTGLIGCAIQSSRSPAIHMAEARSLGMNLVYTPHDLDLIEGGVAALPQVLAQVRAEGYLGVNVTHPFKQAILPLLDGCSDDAKRLGACNTVCFAGGHAIGHNTDWIGFLESFKRGLPGAGLDRVVQLGAGGAGSATTYALLKLGARRIAVHARRPEQAQAFARRFNDLAGEERVVAVTALELEIARAQGVINCTPVGMHKYPGSPLPDGLLHPGLWVADLVYVPLRTAFLRAATARGCRTLEGGGMVIFQAAEGFRIFTGAIPDTARMLRQFEFAIAAERAAS